MKIDSKTTLQLYIEKANRLKSYSFIEAAEKLKLRLPSNGKLEVVGPTIEQIDAFTHTFRFFYRDRDGISFRKLAENLLSDPGLSNHWKDNFIKFREELNTYLDQYPRIKILPENVTPPTRREIIDIFLYGDISHISQQAKLKEWLALLGKAEIYEFEFIHALKYLYEIIINVADLNEKELGIKE